MPATSPTSPTPPVASRFAFAGFWLASAMATLMFVNATRAWLDPSAFAIYMGLPLHSAADAAWVQVYGLRALFIGLTVSVLLLREDASTLKWLAGLALVMSLGDAALVHARGGPEALRHLAISGVLIAAAVALNRWDRAQRRAGRGA